MADIYKINNPVFLQAIAPQIQTYAGLCNVPGMPYESLYTYFSNTIQFGGNLMEFWAAFNGHLPVAFAHWMVKGSPHVSKVYFDGIYNWAGDEEDTLELIMAFLQFGRVHKAQFYEADALDETVYRLFRRKAESLGMELKPQKHINFIAVRRPKNADPNHAAGARRRKKQAKHASGGTQYPDTATQAQ